MCLSGRQQLQLLAGEAVIPYSAIGCCEVEKHSSTLLLSPVVLNLFYISYPLLSNKIIRFTPKILSMVLIS